MPSFVKHIDKAIHNFEFLEQINSNIPNSIDWQITVCYYTALHLVNAHLVSASPVGDKLQYRNHKDVQVALDYTNSTSVVKIDEKPYLKYLDLEMYSRRARYMTYGGSLSSKLPIITDKHLANCIIALDIIIDYFRGVFEKRKHDNGDTTYSFVFPTIELECSKLKKSQTYITKKVPVVIEN